MNHSCWLIIIFLYALGIKCLFPASESQYSNANLNLITQATFDPQIILVALQKAQFLILQIVVRWYVFCTKFTVVCNR